MDFLYSDEQRMLLESADRFGLDNFPATDRLKLLAEGEAGVRRTWSMMAELGWLMLPIAEEQGGLGGGLVEVMALQESLGRHLVPSPFVTSCVLASALLEGAGDAGAELLAAIGAGEAIVAAGLLEADGGYDLHRVALAARSGDGGHVLSGAKCHVEDGADAGWFLISARTAGGVAEREGISLFLVPASASGLTVHRFRAIDGHRHARLELNDVRDAVLLGDRDQALPVIEAAVVRASCAYLAEATGSMESLSAITLDYLRTRHQFGKPIGSFQVLQHRMVDMVIACEEARAMMLHGTLNHHLGAQEWQRAVAAARVRVGECGIYVGQQAVQLHGGVGFSDELIVSHHLKRQMMLAQAHGSIDFHRGRFAA